MSRIVWLLLPLLLLILAAMWFLHEPSEQALDQHKRIASGEKPAAGIATGEVLEATTEAGLAPARVEDPPAADSKESAMDPLPPARLRLRVLDAVTHDPLRKVKARLVYGQRFAETDGGPDLDLPLTPGTWRVHLSSPGYEPTLLESVAVESGEVDAPPTLVFLEPGSSQIVGRLAASHLPLGTELTIELKGAGRRPCPRCSDSVQSSPDPHAEKGSPSLFRVVEQAGPEFTFELSSSIETTNLEDTEEVAAPDDFAEVSSEPFEKLPAPPAAIDPWEREDSCPSCGFAKARSVATCKDGASFEFGPLASGKYLLRAHHSELDPVGTFLRLEIAPASIERVLLQMSGTCRAEIQLHNERGQVFFAAGTDEEQKARESESFPSIRFWFREDDESIGSVRFAIDEVGADWFVSHHQWFFDVSAGSSQQPDRVDRARTPLDTPDPPIPAPGIEQVTLRGQRLGLGRFAIEGLPCRAIDCEVVCGDFGSERQALDLRYRSWFQTEFQMKQGAAPSTSGDEVSLRVFRDGSNLQVISLGEIRLGGTPSSVPEPVGGRMEEGGK